MLTEQPILWTLTAKSWTYPVSRGTVSMDVNRTPQWQATVTVPGDASQFDPYSNELIQLHVATDTVSRTFNFYTDEVSYDREEDATTATLVSRDARLGSLVNLGEAWLPPELPGGGWNPLEVLRSVVENFQVPVSMPEPVTSGKTLDTVVPVERGERVLGWFQEQAKGRTFRYVYDAVRDELLHRPTVANLVVPDESKALTVQRTRARDTDSANWSEWADVVLCLWRWEVDEVPQQYAAIAEAPWITNWRQARNPLVMEYDSAPPLGADNLPVALLAWARRFSVQVEVSMPSTVLVGGWCDLRANPWSCNLQTIEHNYPDNTTTVTYLEDDE